MKKKSIKTGELVSYIIAGFIAFSGVVLAVISIIGDFLTVPNDQNWVRNAESSIVNFTKLPLDWLHYGTILLVLGTFIGIVSILKYAKISIAEKEKATRRAQRLGEEAESKL